MPTPFYYGGQAVIGGVMMRGERNLAVAVHRPNGELVLNTTRLAPIYTGRLRRTPFVRGVIVMLETLVLGIRVLVYSANISLEEEEQEITGPMMWLTLLVALAFGAALFFVAPLMLVRPLDPLLHSALLSNLVEGAIRIIIFVLYLGAMNLVPDLRRVFAYHGAEHKTVNAYEGGVPLEVAAVKNYSTAHVRCGTSFLLAILILAIIIFALLGSPALWLRILSRVILIPVIAAIGYELTRLGAAHAHSRVTRILLAPGLALQKLTTRQPDETQIEAAISALKGVIEADKLEASESG